ncbi:MAG TPA: hypothetical protein DCZ72_02930 [Armatimonadetes bacterium]|nr:hypothetical protein [Armatimonadota bacterium]
MYTTLEYVASAFAAEQWAPGALGAEPAEAAVLEWIEAAGAVLEGRIMGVVRVPVDPARSPRLHAVCAQIVGWRVRADVYDVLYKSHQDGDHRSRQSTVWRAEADRLLAEILAGGIGDGVAASDPAPGALGRAAGVFPEPAFRRGDRW